MPLYGKSQLRARIGISLRRYFNRSADVRMRKEKNFLLPRGKYRFPIPLSSLPQFLFVFSFLTNKPCTRGHCISCRKINIQSRSVESFFRKLMRMKSFVSNCILDPHRISLQMEISARFRSLGSLFQSILSPASLQFPDHSLFRTYD